MDVISDPLAIDPASPRLTTYTDAGRMELSAQTLGNWVAKVANLLVEAGAQPGDEAVLECAPGWQPAAIAFGCWRVGVELVSGGDATSPSFAFVDTPELADECEADEIYMVSRDAFGRGIEESGGRVDFGVEDFSPTVRTQPDAYTGPVVSGQALVRVGGEEIHREDLKAAGERVLTGGWDDVAGMARALAPIFAGGSVVVTTDTSPERVAEIAAEENTTATVV
ncbi:MAG TPA: TIGR03089 family protein [Candidatus Corynebacterium gallistercoris]|uniref:TIGR03089 family protein n=1 Tax=Candidatus Corynebacterium gallistercoris TaxID=2838530 RepID=A0A9D1RXR7_9CORY|nr:TIGR03089 family protein [Candidatus Corynebacterium gallistercoris]